MSEQPNPSAAAARTLVDALIFQGVRHVVISPGSRSAPLAYALARAADAQRVEVHVRIDERVAGFTALGLARFGPAAVITTSGTAAANLHPALLEARHANLGLIAITADRPHEMRGVGANQATEQMHMFGPHIHAVEIPAGASAAAVVNQVSRIVARASGAFSPPEPVHLNIGFRDPLVPEDAWMADTPLAPEVGPKVTPGRTLPGTAQVDLNAATVVVAGDGAGWQAARFAQEHGLPLLAEPSSGARQAMTAIGPYQLVLPELADEVEQVVTFGRPTLSRPVSRLLASAPNLTVVAGSAEWVDVAARATRVAGEVAATGVSDPSWLTRWRAHAEEASAQLPRGMAETVTSHVLGAGQVQVMLGSSMAIRHADVHAPVGAELSTAKIYASRGLAGIDGTISTATGIALASGPTRVVLGDLTFAHDVGGLALGPAERAPDLQIVVLNDGGGGIFATLEHGDERYASTFSRFFATPIEISMEEISRAYGYDYTAIEHPGEIARVLGPQIRGRSIVEVPLPKV